MFIKNFINIFIISLLISSSYLTFGQEFNFDQNPQLKLQLLQIPQQLHENFLQFPLHEETTSTSTSSNAEEPVEEIFLPPRNFNPHPYTSVSSSLPNSLPNFLQTSSFGRNNVELQFNTGPVLFPKNLKNPKNPKNLKNFDGLQEVGEEPYAKLLRKKTKLAKIFANDFNENQVNYRVKSVIGGGGGVVDEDGDNTVETSRALEALATQGAKVLRVPDAADLKKADYYDIPKKDYQFSYKVIDLTSGDDFSHHQRQSAKGGSTNGEYRVRLPDGRLQIVSYTADKNGYKADVKYEGQQQQQYQQQQQQQQQQQHQQQQPEIHDNIIQDVRIKQPKQDYIKYYQPQESYSNNGYDINKYYQLY